MCSLDYDPPTMYVRKPHRCCECARTIGPDERYQRVAGVWDGTFGTHTTCGQCVSAADLLIKHCHGFTHCGIYEDLVEHVDRNLSWGMLAARFAVGMRRQWKRFDGKGLMKTPGPRCPQPNSSSVLIVDTPLPSEGLPPVLWARTVAASARFRVRGVLSTKRIS